MTAAASTDESTYDRALAAAKQIIVALLVATIVWMLATALAPDPTVDGQGARSLLAMPFIAACAAIIALFTLNAFAFDASQLSGLGTRSLTGGVAAGVLWFVLGVFTINTFGLAAVLYLFFGALLVGGLVTAVGMTCQLLVRMVARSPSGHHAGGDQSSQPTSASS